MLLACVTLGAPAHLPYFATWADHSRRIVEASFGPRDILFDGMVSDPTSGDLSGEWTRSNLGAELDNTSGLTKLWIADDVSPHAIYGSLWFAQPLPLNGTVFTWSFLWDDDAVTAHDMNWWFPASKPNNTAYVDTGLTDPFYVWGINGWGGNRVGVERSDGGSSTWHCSPVACGGMPGKPITVTYYLLNGAQYLIVDGSLIGEYVDPRTVHADGTHGFFAFSAYQSAFLVGRVTISKLL